jgi:chitinase
LFPTNLTVSDLNETGFTLNWVRAGGATLYEVFKDGVSVGTSIATSMTISNVAIGNSYSMTVKSKTPSGFESELSTALDVKIPDLHNPTMPGNLTVNAISDYSFTLNWTAATDNVGVTLYEIYMDDKNYGNTGELNLPVPYLTPNTSYSMTVRAKDAAGNVSPFTEPIVVKTLSSTAIELPNSNPSMLISPNPASDFVNINLTTPKSKITVSVLDLIGKTVAKSEVFSQNRKFEFNTSALKKGLYLIHVSDGTFNLMSKLNICR